mgnify:CR=1 FL=1
MNDSPSTPDQPAPASAPVAAPATTPSGGPSPAWERSTVEKLLFATLEEQRSARRWRTFRSLAWLLFFIFVIWSLGFRGAPAADKATAHTAVVEIEGEIGPDTEANAEFVIAAARAAFEDAGAQAVVLLINSPGGSPVQSGIIYDEIRRLRELHADKPLYVVVEEICASGGYYVAAAADKIYVNRASIVGSIGVIMEGFGFTGLMEKVGVDRRLVVSGENKALLDPFSPPNPAQQQYASQLVGEIYQQFVTAVKTGRGDRLKETPDMFTGLIWTGAKSVELGLTDGLGTVESVARDVIKAETVVDYTVKENLAERVAKRVGMSFGAGAVNASLGATQRGYSWR